MTLLQEYYKKLVSSKFLCHLTFEDATIAWHFRKSKMGENYSQVDERQPTSGKGAIKKLKGVV